MTYSKFIPMEVPRTTFQAKMPVRIGCFARIIDKPEAKAMKRQIYSLLYDERPPNIATGPTIVSLDFYFQPAKSDRCKILSPRPKKPDIDNLCKGFLDAMVKAEWIENDQSVVSLQARKWNAADPKQWGVYIKIESFESKFYR